MHVLEKLPNFEKSKTPKKFSMVHIKSYQVMHNATL